LFSEQQMQPLLSSTMWSPVATISSPSMPISPISLTMTAIFSPRWLARIWFKSVVFPAAEKAGHDGNRQAGLAVRQGALGLT
jgi:hypothetical protein